MGQMLALDDRGDLLACLNKCHLVALIIGHVPSHTGRRIEKRYASLTRGILDAVVQLRNALIGGQIEIVEMHRHRGWHDVIFRSHGWRAGDCE